jgi:hypothetical protein
MRTVKESPWKGDYEGIADDRCMVFILHKLLI